MKLLQRLRAHQEAPAPFCSVVVVAAGRSHRMEGRDKILWPMENVPVMIHTLRPFQESDLVDEIILVTREDLMVEAGHLCSQYGITKLKRVVKGGETRTQSVHLGLQETNPTADLIAIHDGARPFVSPEVIARTVEAARQRSAAAPAVPVKNTIKRAKDGKVQETLKREELFAVQTPQVFEASLIKCAIAKAVEEGVSLTDDCAAVERLGFPVCLTEGSQENIKLTTPGDLYVGEAILAERSDL